MDLKDIVAGNLVRIRQRRHMTQEQVADRADISPRYLGQIERRKASPTVTVLGQLAEALEVPPEELVKDSRSID